MIMELEELKTIWSEYDKKLDKNLQLNMDLLRRMNFDKVRFKVRTLLVYKIAEMAILIACMRWMATYIIEYFNSPRFIIPALVLGLLFLTAFIADIRQLALIIPLQLKKHTEAIAPMQKQIETLKIRLINYVRYSFFVIPLYPLMMILSGKVFLNIDFFNVKLIHYLEINTAIAICLVPLIIIPFRMLGNKNLKPRTAKNFLQGTGYYQLTSAEDFLNEVDEFEKE